MTNLEYLKSLLETVADEGVTLGKIGPHFGESGRQAAVAYVSAVALTRIADALERLAASVEAKDGANPTGAEG